ncbi:MAG: ABC transporter substrate-binding protein [Candidatus Coproplasma sp.]
MKIKKLIMSIVACVVGCCSVFGAVGCNSTWTEGTNVTMDFSGAGNINDSRDRSDWTVRQHATASDFSDKTLRIKFFNGGYGRDWIDEMEQKFEAEYPGVDVILTASTNSSDFQTLLENELKGDPYDIYISHDISWETLGNSGLLANLTDLYATTVYTDATPEEGEDENITFSELLSKSSLECSYFNGNPYKVALVQGGGGIMYNKTMFDKYGWELPTTYDELKSLCDQILADTGNRVSPFLCAGSEEYLWTSLVYDWFIQLAGEEEFKRLLAGDDKNCWNSDECPYFEQAMQYWYDLFVLNQDEYMADGFSGTTNITANVAFIEGAVAMMPATAWAANELGADLLEEAQMDVGMFPTPYLENAKKDENGEYIRVTYDVAGRDSIVIAERGNKELAKEFMLWMSETENAKIFPKNVSGALLGFRYDIKSLLEEPETYINLTWDRDMLTMLGEVDYRTTGYSSNPMFILKLVAIMPVQNVYTDCFNGKKNPSSIFDEVWADVNKNWDTWRTQAGLS